MIVTIFSTLLLIFFILLAGMTIIPVFFGAPWHPLSDENIDRIIKFAGLRSGEKFYDLGSGDGRVLIAASKKKFVRGVGVEIDPIKVWLSRFFIMTRKLTGNGMFRQLLNPFNRRPLIPGRHLQLFSCHRAIAFQSDIQWLPSQQE